ncbi:hypothetical protein [Nostoc sp. NZL]|nr:hypothetical protein [Nostoc sp. NZL]
MAQQSKYLLKQQNAFVGKLISSSTSNYAEYFGLIILGRSL